MGGARGTTGLLRKLRAADPHCKRSRPMAGAMNVTAAANHEGAKVQSRSATAWRDAPTRRPPTARPRRPSPTYVEVFMLAKRNEGLSTKTVGNLLNFRHGVFGFSIKPTP